MIEGGKAEREERGKAEREGEGPLSARKRVFLPRKQGRVTRRTHLAASKSGRIAGNGNKDGRSEPP